MSIDLPDVPSALFDDVKAAEKVGRALAITQQEQSPSGVAAIERGRREHPDGTVETYERVEF